MSNLRFALAAIVLFGVAFFVMTYGMPLASKGMTSRPSIANVQVPSASETSATAPALGAAVESKVAEPKAASKTAASKTAASKTAASKTAASKTAAPSAEKGRDRLAQTALQAAQAYAGAPCDRMAKTAFIVAASTYLRAQDASAKVPKDARVHDAIKAAFESGNVSLEDFPPDVVMTNRFTAAPSRASCINSAGLQP